MILSLDIKNDTDNDDDKDSINTDRDMAIY